MIAGKESATGSPFAGTYQPKTARFFNVLVTQLMERFGPLRRREMRRREICLHPRPCEAQAKVSRTARTISGISTNRPGSTILLPTWTRPSIFNQPGVLRVIGMPCFLPLISAIPLAAFAFLRAQALPTLSERLAEYISSI